MDRPSINWHKHYKAITWPKPYSGNSDAQYELAVRMIRGKKNTLKQQQELKRLANAAANQAHVGALIFLANQHKNGYGGFKKSTDLAVEYYRQALQNSKGQYSLPG